MANINYYHDNTIYGSVYTSGLYDNGSRAFSSANKPTVTDITASGTPSAITYLRGDGAWVTPPSSSGSSGSAISSKQYGTFNITSGTSGTSTVTFSNNLNVPYTLSFYDLSDGSVVQQFNVSNYTTSGFTVGWNAIEQNRTITWLALDGFFSPGAVVKTARRVTTSATVNSNDCVITYTGSSSISQTVPVATGSLRELVFTNDSSDYSVVYTLVPSSGTIGGDTSIELYSKESITIFDAAAGIWEVH